MKKFFAFSGDDSRLSALPDKRFCGVLIKIEDFSCENVRKIKEYGLEIWIYAESDEEEASYIDGRAGRVEYYRGKCTLSRVEKLEELKERAGEAFEDVSGFVTPLPSFGAPFWNSEMDEMCGCPYDIEEALMKLFDFDTEISPERSWYYKYAGRYILSKCVLPLKERAEEYGKQIIFDMGKTGTEFNFDFALRTVSPIRYLERGLTLAVHGNKSVEMLVMFSAFPEIYALFAEDDIDGESETKGTAELLLIKPTRGITERYVFDRKKAKSRAETPALCAEAEGTYYCRRLHDKGIRFDIADEFSVERMGSAKNGEFILRGRRYRKILLCESCIFSKSAIEILKQAQKEGVSINDTDLIRFLDENAEEEKEWEKL